jgi:Tol biopolymer transport system component
MNIENFGKSVLVDKNLIDDGCINCHTYSGQHPTLSFFHIRNKSGGTMIQENGKFRKINTATDSTISAGVYGSWHPSGRFIAFSTNVIIPEFHSINNLRLEVYDTISDVVVLDIEKNEIIKNKLLSGENEFETFPAFSADGKTIFFCSAKATKMPENYKSVRYSLCALSFNPDSGSFGTKIDTLISAYRTGKTLSQPKPSYDGKYILFTSFDYGNFPVWHKEADLHLLKLSDLTVDTIPIVNSNHADSYHSWSSNSRWFVFASKRDDGMYGKPYFAHIDENGKCGKPFQLPPIFMISS